MMQQHPLPGEILNIKYDSRGLQEPPSQCYFTHPDSDPRLSLALLTQAYFLLQGVADNYRMHRGQRRCAAVWAESNPVTSV